MTTPDNPLVAAPAAAAPGAWAGVAIAEDVREIDAAVRDRSWVDGALAGVGGALDGLVLVVDPLGSLLQYGIAWLIEQVKPLTEALDWLAGDAARITAHARTWTNVAGALVTEADGLARAAGTEVAGWGGAAGEAYRTWIGHREQELRTLGTAAGTMAAMAEGAGGLVGAVRLMVRDAIAAVVARLTLYAAELAATRGIALPLVVGQVTALCAAWAARIGRWLKALLDSLRKLLGEGDRLTAAVRSPGGRSGSPGRFDAGRDRAPLGGGFRSGVADPEKLFLDKERAIADRLAVDGAMVHPRRRVADVTGLTSPDAMVRTGPDDPGVVTEFKTPESASTSSVRANILAAGKQVDQHGGGDVVLDGRVAGLTGETARQGYARAAGHARVHGSPLPERVRVILADGTILELP